MVIYKNTDSVVTSTDDLTPLFHITSALMQVDTIAPFVCIVCNT